MHENARMSLGLVLLPTAWLAVCWTYYRSRYSCRSRRGCHWCGHGCCQWCTRAVAKSKSCVTLALLHSLCSIVVIAGVVVAIVVVVVLGVVVVVAVVGSMYSSELRRCGLVNFIVANLIPCPETRTSSVVTRPGREGLSTWGGYILVQSVTKNTRKYLDLRRGNQAQGKTTLEKEKSNRMEKQKSRVRGKRESREHLSHLMVGESRQQQGGEAKRVVDDGWRGLLKKETRIRGSGTGSLGLKQSTPVPGHTRPVTKEQVKGGECKRESASASTSRRRADQRATVTVMTLMSDSSFRHGRRA
ncbi:hypothetical protein EDB83DRAFT_2325559 [Lactarius deliciosus]|nr:hypothetical protein EDB83DRAFT_2325559 [Lactarius deliciosus]